LLLLLLLLVIFQDQKIDSAGGDANFEALAKYGTDLTANAARLDPVIGRDDEIRRVVRILSRSAGQCEGGQSSGQK
jgi:ATP-dependent Clp protease ATP-binding subunit ClpA